MIVPSLDRSLRRYPGVVTSQPTATLPPRKGGCPRAARPMTPSTMTGARPAPHPNTPSPSSGKPHVSDRAPPSTRRTHNPARQPLAWHDGVQKCCRPQGRQ
jgi:hypothetical protein